MENKTLITVFVIVLMGALLFFGSSITGLVIYKVEYNDLCKIDEHCSQGEECCLIYEDKDVGICMEQCQSFEFLCQASDECEDGTVCCISEGMEYGICNIQDKCLSVDIFADYVGRMTFYEPEKEPTTQQPIQITSKGMIIIEAIVIISLIGFIIWLLSKKKKK